MLKAVRKWRARFWRWQIVCGDVIAILTGRFINRWILKKTLRKSGRALKRITG